MIEDDKLKCSRGRAVRTTTDFKPRHLRVLLRLQRDCGTLI